MYFHFSILWRELTSCLFSSLSFQSTTKKSPFFGIMILVFIKSFSIQKESSFASNLRTNILFLTLHKLSFASSNLVISYLFYSIYKNWVFLFNIYSKINNMKNLKEYKNFNESKNYLNNFTAFGKRVNTTINKSEKKNSMITW